MYNLILSFFLLFSLVLMGYGMYLLLAKNINANKYIPQYVKNNYKNVGIGCLIGGSVTAIIWSVLLYKLNFMEKNFRVLSSYQSPSTGINGSTGFPRSPRNNFGFRFY
jgi:hypothetical protein